MQCSAQHQAVRHHTKSTDGAARHAGCSGPMRPSVTARRRRQGSVGQVREYTGPAMPQHTYTQRAHNTHSPARLPVPVGRHPGLCHLVIAPSAHTHTHIHTRTHTHTHTHTQLQDKHTHTHTHTIARHTHTHTHIHTHNCKTNTHTHTHSHIRMANVQQIQRAHTLSSFTGRRRICTQYHNSWGGTAGANTHLSTPPWAPHCAAE